MRDAKAAQEKALADLRDTFKALSADALKQSAPEFLRLAEQSFGKFQETAKGDLAQRQEAIKGLVEPLKQQLETYQKNLQSKQRGAIVHARRGEETIGIALATKHSRSRRKRSSSGWCCTRTRRAANGARKHCGASSRRRA